jgi:hypothetical protein
MKKPAKGRIREERLRNEVIVDAYGSQEQAMGWYYYLDGKMLFPFQARCTVTRTVFGCSSHPLNVSHYRR